MTITTQPVAVRQQRSAQQNPKPTTHAGTEAPIQINVFPKGRQRRGQQTLATNAKQKPPAISAQEKVLNWLFESGETPCTAKPTDRCMVACCIFGYIPMKITGFVFALGRDICDPPDPNNPQFGDTVITRRIYNEDGTVTIHKSIKRMAAIQR